LQLELAAPLLQDQLLAVRIEAARAVSAFRANLPVPFEEAFRVAEQELIEAMQAIAERPEAHGNLAGNYVEAGNVELALREFRTALRMDPGSVQARANLADFYRRLDRDDDAETLLREGFEITSNNAALHHSLGLLLIRDGRADEGLEELRLAAGEGKDNARYQYVYAVALNSLDQPEAAVELLMSSKNRFPADFDIHWALATILRDQGRNDAAKAIAEEMAERYPGMPAVQNLWESL
jgi:tetratricopeptide (TPR) repeat protein